MNDYCYEMWKSYLEALDYPFSLNVIQPRTWGSCQYHQAVAMYDTLNAMSSTELSLEKIYELLHIKVTYSKINAELVAIEKISHEVEDTLWDIYNIQDCFTALKDKAFDLWTASKVIAEAVFEGLIIACPTPQGFGPYYNVLAQGDNFNTGIRCFLLIKHGLVKDETVFQNFDT